MSPQGEWPEMHEVCGLRSPLLVKLYGLADHLIIFWELELLT